jgi:hypothetical protein
VKDNFWQQGVPTWIHFNWITSDVRQLSQATAERLSRKCRVIALIEINSCAVKKESDVGEEEQLGWPPN